MMAAEVDGIVADRNLTERLAEALDPCEEILEAYLFGSHARGQARRHSDLDIVLVHHYIEVDVEVVSRVLGGRLDEFEEFASLVERSLDE